MDDVDRVEAQSWDAHRERWQAITNARPIPPRVHQRRDRPLVGVRVRVVWERDGAEWLDGTAADWVGHDVLVEVRDPRSRYRWVWVPAGDVRRQERPAARRAAVTHLASRGTPGSPARCPGGSAPTG